MGGNLQPTHQSSNGAPSSQSSIKFICLSDKVYSVVLGMYIALVSIPSLGRAISVAKPQGTW